jgi:hypothetical protein
MLKQFALDAFSSIDKRRWSKVRFPGSVDVNIALDSKKKIGNWKEFPYSHIILEGLL